MSDIFTSTISSQPVFQIVAAPIKVGETPTYILAASLDLGYLVEALRKEDLPPGWVGALSDRNGIVAVRTEGQADYAGKPASPALRAHMDVESGTYYGRNVAGQEALVGHAKSKLTGWTAAASASAEIVAAPLRRSFRILVGLGLVLGLIAAGIAVLVGRRVEGAMHRLNESATAIGQGDPVGVIATPILEVNRVGSALAVAAMKLQTQARERDLAEVALRDLNAELEGRVVARTSDLDAANRLLIAEMQSREAAEGQLRQLQKMEAVGQLTGGIGPRLQQHARHRHR